MIWPLQRWICPVRFDCSRIRRSSWEAGYPEAAWEGGGSFRKIILVGAAAGGPSVLIAVLDDATKRVLKALAKGPVDKTQLTQAGRTLARH